MTWLATSYCSQVNQYINYLYVAFVMFVKHKGPGAASVRIQLIWKGWEIQL